MASQLTGNERSMCSGPMRADLLYGSIPAMARSSAARFGSEAAVVDGDVTLGFDTVAELMYRVASSLIANGVRPGDRVALWAPNSAAWIPAALGIQAAGAWLVPLNTRYRGAEAAYILRRVDAAAFFVVEDFRGTDYLEMLRAEAPDLRCLGNVVLLPAPGTLSGAHWSDFVAAGRSVEPHEVDSRIDSLTPESVCDVIFTSGTTGEPKGVLLSHGRSLRCYESYNSAFGLGRGDRHLIANPFFHCFGYKAGWMLSLLVGATTIPVSVFEAGEVLDLIGKHGVTHMPGSPTMFWSLINHPDREAVWSGTLDTVMLAAASIPVELVAAARSVLRIPNVLTGYGLTENHALGTFTRPGDSNEVIASTVGRPAPDLQMRLVDTHGQPVVDGTEGELEILGYSHMLGYYDDPQATADAFHDGWLRTGDVARIDDQGNVSITDRKKDMYIMGGFNVAPAEVEAVLLGVDGVREVAVIGVPDDRFGEVGAAFVVTDPSATVTAEAVVERARDRLANFKVPRYVRFVDGLPHNATGKVLKGALRELARAF